MYIYSNLCVIQPKGCKNKDPCDPHDPYLHYFLLQENRFSAERTTRSKAEVVDYKGLCFSRGVKLAIPPRVSTAAAFPDQLNLCQMIDKAWIEELTWKVHV